MRLIGLAVALTVSLVLPPLAVEAQQAGNVARMGFLGATTSSGYAGQVEALRAGLRDLGYVEGQTILIEYRWAEGRYERLPDLAKDPLRSGWRSSRRSLPTPLESPSSSIQTIERCRQC
jgi:putative ABC transport system substrate-binding protein